MSRGRILPTLLFLRWAHRVNHKQQWAEGRVAPGDCAPLWALAAPTPSSATPPSTSAATGASATASRLCRGLLATGLVQLVLAEVLRVLRRRLLRLGSTTTPTCTATPTRHGLPRGTAAATAATSLHLRVVEVSSWDIATAGHGWQHRGSRAQQRGSAEAGSPLGDVQSAPPSWWRPSSCRHGQRHGQRHGHARHPCHGPHRGRRPS